MEEITHVTRNLRIAPRKLRLVIDKMRHMPAGHATEVLPLVVNKGARLAEKSLKSAIEVAKDRGLNPDTLLIQRVWAGEGMKLKRIIGHSRGRMAPIHKHYSHLSIVLKGEPLAKSRSARAAKASEQTEETPVKTEEN